MTNSQFHHGKPVAALIALMLAALAATGCTSQYRDYSAFIHHPRPVVTSQAYHLAPPDQVVINSHRVQEIDGVHDIIRPDGKITLPLLGDVFDFAWKANRRNITLLYRYHGLEPLR